MCHWWHIVCCGAFNPQVVVVAVVMLSRYWKHLREPSSARSHRRKWCLTMFTTSCQRTSSDRGMSSDCTLRSTTTTIRSITFNPPAAELNWRSLTHSALDCCWSQIYATHFLSSTEYSVCGGGACSWEGAYSLSLFVTFWLSLPPLPIVLSPFHLFCQGKDIFLHINWQDVFPTSGYNYISYCDALNIRSVTSAVA